MALMLEIMESLVKRGSLLTALVLTGLMLAGCASPASHDSSPTQAPATQTATQSPLPAPTVKENPFLEYSWKKADFTFAEGVLTAGDSTFVVPGDATEVPTADERVVWAYRNSTDGQTVVLSAVGVANVGGDAENYAKVLNESGHVEAGTIAYVRDAEFGPTTAMRFDVSDPSNHASIYAFDHDGVAYELTISAPTAGLLETTRLTISESSIAAE